MSIFLLSFLVIVLAVAGMSLGVLLGREPIKGSCGGIGGGRCASCVPASCPGRRRTGSQAD